MNRWPKATIGDLVEFRGGGTPAKNNPAFYKGDIPWVTSKDMKNWEIFGSQEMITLDAIKESAAILHPKDSVLIVVRSGILKHTFPVAVSRVPLAVNQDLKALICKEGVDHNYLARMLKASQPIVLGWVRATTADNFPVDNLKKLEIPFPAIREQKRIAAILDQADSLRRLRQRAIDRLNTLEQSIYSEMFSDTKNKSWPMMRLSRLGRVVTGATPPSDQKDLFCGEVPFITPGDLQTDALPKRYLSEEGARRSRTVRLGSAMVCCIGATIGKMDKARKLSAFNQQINAVEWSETINDDYGIYALTRLKKKIISRGTSTTLPILKKSEFEKIEIPVPPDALQKEFSARISEFELVREPMVAAAIRSDSLFLALQHRAFRGEL